MQTGNASVGGSVRPRKTDRPANVFLICCYAFQRFCKRFSHFSFVAM